MEQIQCSECGSLAVIPWDGGYLCCTCGHEFDRRGMSNPPPGHFREVFFFGIV